MHVFLQNSYSGVYDKSTLIAHTTVDYTDSENKINLTERSLRIPCTQPTKQQPLGTRTCFTAKEISTSSQHDFEALEKSISGPPRSPAYLEQRKGRASSWLSPVRCATTSVREQTRRQQTGRPRTNSSSTRQTRNHQPYNPNPYHYHPNTVALLNRLLHGRVARKYMLEKRDYSQSVDSLNSKTTPLPHPHHPPRPSPPTPRSREHPIVHGTVPNKYKYK